MASQCDVVNNQVSEVDTLEFVDVVGANSSENSVEVLVRDDSSDIPVTGSSNGISNVVPPTVGMEFSDPDEAYRFYLHYAYYSGFGVMRNGGSCKVVGNRKPRLILNCHKSGKPRHVTKRPVNERNRTVVKTGCQGGITLVLESVTNCWVISRVVLEHNHKLCPDHSHKLTCFRELKDHVKRQLEVNDNASVPAIGNINAVTQMAGGEEHCGFTERDARNYIAKIRRLNLGKGDAEALMEYFRQSQSVDPNFFYECKFDDENRLERVFWADSVCRSSYKYFGDVVTFDATYIVNK